MNIVKLTATAAIAGIGIAHSAMAGGLAPAIEMEPVEIMEETGGSSSNLLIPLILLTLIFAASGGGSSVSSTD